ncbi:hypothetical protein MBLNU457_5021t1 [Dothideomycetes sp. NU457]
MPQETAFWLIAINGGCCPESTPKGIFNNKPDASKDSQKWIGEKGDAPDKVAFYNVAEKKYLRAKNGNAATKVELGEKQWWTLERDGDSGTYWIKCNDFKDAYLCNAYAKHTEDNTVYMWPKQANWQHSMRWYIQEAGVHDFTTGAGGSDASSGADFAEKEKALSERENALAEKEKALAEKEQSIAAKEADQKTQADQLTAKEKELEEQAKAKTEISDDASQAEKEWTDKLADLQRQLDGLREKEREMASKEVEVQKVRQQNDDKTAELQRKEKELQQQTATTTEDMDKLRDENSDLKQEAARLKKQLEDARKPSTPNAPQAVDSQDSARLKDENRRLRDLFVDHVLKAQDSDRGAASTPSKSPLASTPAAAPASAPKSVSFAAPSPEETAPKPVPARRNGSAVHDRPHANGTASPKPSANTSRPLKQPSAATDKSSSKPQPVKSAAKPSPSSQQASELEHQQSSATDKPNSKSQPVKSAASARPLPSSPQVSELDQVKQENNRLKQHAEQSQKEKGGKGRSELSNGANGSPKVIARPNWQKGAASKNQGADEDAIVFNCGHVIHPPPRKLERRVLGIMYE